MSQNVWFDSFQSGTRWRALARLMREQNADVYCLQEVTEPSLALLLDDPWIRGNLLCTNNISSFEQQYDVCMFVAKDRQADVVGGTSHRLPLTSIYQRGLLSLRMRLGASECVVGTVHLESRAGQYPNRKKQWEEIQQYVAANGGTAFIGGDMNHCSTWPQEADVIDKSVTQDAWTVLNGEDTSRPGFYTENTDANKMLLAARDGSPKHVRFDRILFVDHTKQFHWQPTSFQTIGTRAVADGIWISDHFGIAAEYRLLQ